MRAPHAALDVESRIPKARKIEVLLSRERPLEGARLLEVGIGAGVILSRLARALGPSGEAWGVDVLDQRTVRDGYQFRPVAGVELPFEDGSFDVVVSNQVIEHVGDLHDQRRHLREIRRVLRPGGIAYLAAPSRWALVEPHFKLPLLSWLPVPLRSAYIRLARRGSDYDCRPPTRGELVRGFADAGLAPDEVTADAVVVMAGEEPSPAARAAAALPRPLRRALARLSPTMIFVLRPRGD